MSVGDHGCWEIGDVLFDFDKFNIKPIYYEVLDEVAATLRQNPGLKIRIDGHTDIIGLEKYNDELSINRAKSGRAYLESKGAATEQITIKGYGYSSPRATNKTARGRDKNRRIEFQQVRP